MKITIVTGVWQRPNVFEMFAKGIKNLGVDLRVIVAGSEGKRSEEMVLAHGFEYIEINNKPLGRKMNATTLAAKGSDYVVCMGSDDVLSPELFQHYLKYMSKGYDFIGLSDFYFYDTKTKRAMYWGGYTDKRKGMTVGAGRVISSRLMNSMNWTPWNNEADKSLDSIMNNQIKGKQKVLRLKDLNVLAVDIKSSTNITKFKQWENAEFINPNILTDKFTYLK